MLDERTTGMVSLLGGATETLNAEFESRLHEHRDDARPSAARR